MGTIVRLIDILAVLPESDFLIHVDTLYTRSCFDKRPIEEVSVVCDHDCWSSYLYMFEEPFQHRLLVRLVENHKRSLVLRLRCVLEVCNVFRYDLAVCDEKSLTVDHVRYHHDLIDGSVWKLQWEFCRFDIVRHDDGICWCEAFLYALDAYYAMLGLDSIPVSNSDVLVNSHSHVVRNVVFSDI